MFRYIHELGYVTTTDGPNIIRLFAHKLGGSQILVQPWDGQLISFEVRLEQKIDQRASRGRVYAHETIYGTAAHVSAGVDCGGSKSRQMLRAAIAKRTARHRYDDVGITIRQTTRRLAHEGDELNLELRLRPEMKNQEVILMSGWGPNVDGEWQTASVIHRIEGGNSVTQAACWRKH